MKSRRLSDPLAVVVGLYVVLAVGYNLANPIFESPDERLHFDFVRYIQRTGTLPVETLNGDLTEFHQPPVYYVLAAALTAWLPDDGYEAQIRSNPFWAYDIGRVGRDNKNQYLHPPEGHPWTSPTVVAVHVIRLLSTLAGVAVIVGTQRLVRELAPGREDLAIAAAALTAFIPNFLLTTTSITNDSFVAAAPVWLAVWSLRALRRSAPPGWREAALFGAAFGVSALAKVSSYPTGIVIGLMVAIWAWRTRSWAYLLRTGLIMAAVFLAVSGWWFARNLALYGDLTGLGQMWLAWGVREPLTLAQIPVELYNIRTTFWLNFGYGNVPAPEGLYFVLDGLTLVAVIGLGRIAWRRRSEWRSPAVHAPWLLVGIWLIVTVVALFWYLQRTQQVTGRQVYAALPAISALLVVGWDAWRRGWRTVTQAGVVVAGAAALALYGLFGVLIPSYAPPPLLSNTAADLRIAQRLDWTFGDVARLRGLTVDRDEVRSGDRLAVTLYWEPLRVTADSLAVFVQVIGADDRKVGQRDTLPGLGNEPTPFWRVGGILEDRMEIPIDGGDAVSSRVDLLVGLTYRDTGERLPAVDAAGQSLSRPVAGSLIYRGAAAATPVVPLNVAFEQGLALRGYTLSNGPDGRPEMLTLFWAPSGPLDADYTVFLQLFGSSAEPVAQFDGPPRGGWYPTSIWAKGEAVADEHALALPADLPAGAYTLKLGLYRDGDGARLQRLDGLDHVDLTLVVP